MYIFPYKRGELGLTNWHSVSLSQTHTYTCTYTHTHTLTRTHTHTHTHTHIHSGSKYSILPVQNLFWAPHSNGAYLSTCLSWLIYVCHDSSSATSVFCAGKREVRIGVCAMTHAVCCSFTALLNVFWAPHSDAVCWSICVPWRFYTCSVTLPMQNVFCIRGWIVRSCACHVCLDSFITHSLCAMTLSVPNLPWALHLERVCLSMGREQEGSVVSEMFWSGCSWSINELCQ